MQRPRALPQLRSVLEPERRSESCRSTEHSAAHMRRGARIKLKTDGRVHGYVRQLRGKLVLITFGERLKYFEPGEQWFSIEEWEVC